MQPDAFTEKKNMLTSNNKPIVTQNLSWDLNPNILFRTMVNLKEYFEIFFNTGKKKTIRTVTHPI